MVDQSRILGAIQNMEIFNKGHVLILNEQNQVLASNSSSTMPADFPYANLDNATNFYFNSDDGEKYEVFNIQSPRSKLKYVSIMPSTIYWQKASHIRNLTYISMAHQFVWRRYSDFCLSKKKLQPCSSLGSCLFQETDLESGKTLQ